MDQITEIGVSNLVSLDDFKPLLNCDKYVSLFTGQKKIAILSTSQKEIMKLVN